MNEEPEILDRLRRGERVDHYDTVRRCKDGSLLDISLTISPLQGADGKSSAPPKLPGMSLSGAGSGAAKAACERDETSHQEFAGDDPGHRNPNLQPTPQ